LLLKVFENRKMRLSLPKSKLIRCEDGCNAKLNASLKFARYMRLYFSDGLVFFMGGALTWIFLQVFVQTFALFSVEVLLLAAPESLLEVF